MKRTIEKKVIAEILDSAYETAELLVTSQRGTLNGPEEIALFDRIFFKLLAESIPDVTIQELSGMLNEPRNVL